VFLTASISGIVYATAGALIHLRRPDNATGLVLMAAAALPAALIVVRYLFPALVGVQVASSMQLTLLPLAFVVLTFPLGRFPSSLERAVFLGATAIAIAAGILEAITIEPIRLFPPAACQPCSPNPVRLVDYQLYPAISAVDNMVLAVLATVIIVVVVRRWRSASGLTHAALTPVLIGGAVLAVGYALVIGLNPVASVPASVTAPVLLTLRLTVPIGLTVVFLRFNAARSAVVRELVRLGPRTSLSSVQASLRQMTGDPSLTVARWSRDGYLDAVGGHVGLEPSGTDRRVLTVDRAGAPVAAVAYDAALDLDQELLAVIADTVRYAAESSEIHDQLIARGGDVARLPTGTVTFLFGDIERSTELLHRLGERYAGLLAAYREQVRRIAEHRSGQVVDLRADECFLAFANAGDAVAAAIDLQAAVKGTRWPDHVEVRVRIGLHTGQPELTADGYVGMDVHHAARVMAAAMGGQTFGSARFVEALGTHPPDDIELTPLGMFALRGLAGEEALYSVSGSSS
jgi:class 3 adenylate cyclase